MDVFININHPFFKPFSEDEKFKSVLEQFVISFAVAEKIAKIVENENGMVKPSTVRNKLNEVLRIIAEKESEDN